MNHNGAAVAISKQGAACEAHFKVRIRTTDGWINNSKGRRNLTATYSGKLTGKGEIPAAIFSKVITHDEVA